MILTDSCCYIGSWTREPLAFDSVQGLLAEMDRLGIAKALVSHTLAWQNSPAIGNPLLMSEIAGHSRLEPCWVVIPGEAGLGKEGASQLCQKMAAQNVRAVRLCPRDHVYPLAGWMVGDLLDALNERQYLVFIDMDQVVLPSGLFDLDPDGWRNIFWMCQSYPKLKVIVTRVGYRSLRVLLPLMQACKNLYIDLSYFSTHLGLEEIVAQIGSERVLFGTSQPIVDPAGAVTRLMLSSIAESEKENIAHKNLEHILQQVKIGGDSSWSSYRAVSDCPVGNGKSQGKQYSKQPYNLTLAPSLDEPFELGFEIIDAHGHLGPYRDFHIPDPSISGMLEVMDRCNVSKAGIASHMALGPDWIRGNRLTAEAVSTHPDRLIGQVVANPHVPEKIETELLQAFDQFGMKAIKLHPDLAAYPITGPGYQAVWEFASDRGALILCHTFHGSRYCDPQVFGSLADKYPQVPILLVHSGAITAAFEGAIALSRQHSNLYLDVSGSFITGHWIKRMVNVAGSDKVVFSSDIPFIDLRYSLGRVIFAGLTNGEAAAVLGGNIRRLLKKENS